MTCIYCGIGELKPGKASLTLTKGDKSVRFTDVPALVCDNCGENYFEPEINGRLLEAANELFNSTEKTRTFTFDEIHNLVS